MRIEITILSAPISVSSLSQVSPVSVELAGIGTLTVNNYYSEGGARGYDDTEIRNLIAQGDNALAEYLGQQLSAISQDIGTVAQQSQQNTSAIQSINTAMLQIPIIQEAAAQNSQAISTINGTLGDIATVLDAINGEAI